jgi:arsenate reductase
LGDCLKVHWGLADPSRLEGTAEEVAAAFQQTIDRLRRRLQLLIAANPATLDSARLSALFTELGEA